MTTETENQAPNTDDDGLPMDDDVLLREIVLAMVQHPEDVDLTVREDDRGKLLVIHCAVEDRGKVIGRDGCNIQAIQTLFRSIGNFSGPRKLVVALENLELKQQEVKQVRRPRRAA